jgi:hypothetical protein
MSNIINLILDEISRSFYVSKQLAENLNIAPIVDIGQAGESLACALFQTKGSGTNGGMSFDTASGHEVKTVCKIQSKSCKHCSCKNAFFTSVCHQCGGADFKYVDDSRAGISSKSHFRYKNELESYIIFDIVPENYSHDVKQINITGWIINKDNEFFNSMLRVQAESGSDSKNLLTTSVEFYLSAPSKFFEAKLDISSDTGNNTYKINSHCYDKAFVPIVERRLFNRNYKDLFVKIPKEGYNSVVNSLRVVARKGTHGKRRGNVSRKNLSQR